MYRYAVVILRAQPFHFCHKLLIEKALSSAKKVIVALGSARSSPSIQNPFPYELRKRMILAEFPSEDLTVVPVRDYYYNYPAWLSEVKSKVLEAIEVDAAPHEICLIGSRKDYDTQKYLESLGSFWTFEPVPVVVNAMSGTSIRTKYFENDGWENHVSLKTAEILDGFSSSSQFHRLIKEHLFVKDYIKKTQHEDPSRYYVQLSTVDVVCMHSAHILMTRRKGPPGEGQIALPGGFIEKGETAHNAAFRELREETSIAVPKDRLRDFLRGEENGYRFDHPKRDVRGRVATQGFFIKLPDKWTTPAVKGGDDASKAFWMPYYDLFRREEEIYSDHVHIAFNLINKLGQSN